MGFLVGTLLASFRLCISLVGRVFQRVFVMTGLCKVLLLMLLFLIFTQEALSCRKLWAVSHVMSLVAEVTF